MSDWFEDECRLSEAENHMSEVVKLLNGCDNVSGLIDLAEELRDFIRHAQEFVID